MRHRQNRLMTMAKDVLCERFYFREGKVFTINIGVYFWVIGVEKLSFSPFTLFTVRLFVSSTVHKMSGIKLECFLQIRSLVMEFHLDGTQEFHSCWTQCLNFHAIRCRMDKSLTLNYITFRNFTETHNLLTLCKKKKKFTMNFKRDDKIGCELNF